jgi:hypothetical protein
MAGVPEELAESARVMVVLAVEQQGEGGERFAPGDVVMLGAGDGYGVYRRGRGSYELCDEPERGGAVARGDILGILKKFSDLDGNS